jgi:putative phosphonate metabolism protein
MTTDILSKLALSHAHRFALYFAPAIDDPWWQSGSEWLGRDAFTGASCRQPPLAGLLASEQERLTAAPRRYGWHATLKAPFALVKTADIVQLRSSLRELCRSFTPFSLPELRVTRLDDFLALVPADESAELDRIARSCVSKLHRYAAPLSPRDLARRRAADLSAAEDALLLKWGYPYVMEHFRFHMSLTGSLSDVSVSGVEVLRSAATTWFGKLPPCRFASISLFAEPTPGSDFVLLEQIPLGLQRE